MNETKMLKKGKTDNIVNLILLLGGGGTLVQRGDITVVACYGFHLVPSPLLRVLFFCLNDR